jgi:oligoribonuclease NrnB/cAMP/cGMP phosphodiesterase (DHH superfamily)
MAHQTPLELEPLRDKNIMLVDICFTKPRLIRMREIAQKVLILDHHETAFKDHHGDAGCFFDMQHSGAILAWHYFHGMQSPPPRLLTLIEDRDLWRLHDRSTSEPLSHALQEKYAEPDFRALQVYLNDAKLDTLIQFGRTLMQHNQQWCIETGKRAKFCSFYSSALDKIFSVLAIELEKNRKLISELAEHLYLNSNVDFIMLWYQQSDGNFKVSLRTLKPEINVATIANTFPGGGGHPRAAGMLLAHSPWALLEPSDP